MASLALRNARNFQDAQWRRDTMELPVEPDRWIETKQGREWLDLSAGLLINGIDVVISCNPKVEVKTKDFITAFGEAAVEIYAYDPKNGPEWALARGIPFAGGEQYQKLAREVAEGLLLEHEKAAEKSHSFLEDY